MADEAGAAAEAEAWGLTVKTLEPGSYAVRVPGGGGAAVADLKAAIHAAQPHLPPPARQRLLFCGRALQDARRLADCGLADGLTLHMVERPEGAPVLAQHLLE